MTKKNIVFFEVAGWQKEYLKKGLLQHNLQFFENDIDAESLKKARQADILAVFVGSRVDKKVLAALPQVKLVTTMSTGYDHIDLKAAQKQGIAVTTVPYYGENTVAEHAMALLLALAHKIPQSWDRTNRGHFNFDGLMGFDIKGKTIGVIGTGHIGQHVIRMANGFEMDVIAYDKYPNKKLEKQLGFTYVSLLQLLKKSDIISLHVPYSPLTRHMLNSVNMRFMKKGVVIINTARGALIDTKALVKYLRDGRIGAVGLDVLEDEKPLQEESEMLKRSWSGDDMRVTIVNHYLMHAENALITPHNAFNSREAIVRILDTTIENIEEFVSGRKLKNQVQKK